MRDRQRPAAGEAGTSTADQSKHKRSKCDDYILQPGDEEYDAMEEANAPPKDFKTPEDAIAYWEKALKMV